MGPARRPHRAADAILRALRSPRYPARPWKAITRHTKGQPYERDTWELYHSDTDFAEARDLAAREPAKLAELQALWEREAAAYGVFPLDDRSFERDLLRPPEHGGDRTHFVYHPPLEGLHKGTAPDLRGRGFTLTATIDRRAGDDGVLVAQGGRFCGYALWIRDGRLAFDYNVSGLERTSVLAPAVLPAGASTVSVELLPAAAPARGAALILRVDGREVARATAPRAMPGMISHEPLDFGRDTQTPVTDAYASPHTFPGQIKTVEFTLRPTRP